MAKAQIFRDVQRSGESNRRISHLMFVTPGNASGMHTALSSIKARRPCTRLHPHIGPHVGSAMQKELIVQASRKTAWMPMTELLLIIDLLLMIELSHAELSPEAIINLLGDL